MRKRDIEKAKRKQRKKEKVRKMRRARKKELNKVLLEKRNELYRRQQEHMVEMIEKNRKFLRAQMDAEK